MTGVGQERALLGGRYRLGEKLGSGGMGTVWAARDERLHRDVAVKEVIPPAELGGTEREAVTKRTMREARAAARITSPAAVTVFDVVDQDGRPWIVMERLDARTLSDVIAERGPLPPSEVARIGLSLLDALEAAHAAGVLHRDVKPANVMITTSGAAVLTDFGIATLEGDPALTTSGTLVGSPAYLAPERARGDAASRASDLWSLGATMYTAVEGRSPFQREGQIATLAAVVTDKPDPTSRAGSLAPVIGLLLAKEPAERPSPATVRARLEAVAAGGGDETSATSVLPVAQSVLPVAQSVPPVAQSADLREAERTAVVPLQPGRPATAPPVPEPERAVPASPPRGAGPPPGGTARSRRWAAVLVALVVGVLAVGLWIALRTDGTDGTDDAAGGSVEPGATATDAPTGATPTEPDADSPPPSDTASEPDPDSPPSTDQQSPAEPAADVPPGFRLYTDAAGWSLAVPEGWEESRDGSRVDFSSGEGPFLRVDSTDTPAGDPVADWESQEQSVSQQLEGYERESIEAVEYREYDAADWIFTFDAEGTRLRVINRGFVVSEDEAHAIYFSAAEDGFDDGPFQVATQTFTPGG